jgi:tetraacyldisaccharide 4'-kinase
MWYGSSAGARAARAALTPVSWLYRVVVAARNALYDHGIIATHRPPVPVVSVGNISVGGTGKTPVSAWLTGQLAADGHRPAIVMRGYGTDEVLLHVLLNPGVQIIADVDRVAGIRQAVRNGADVVVLDDGFQHRRAGRNLDIVLVGAEQWLRSRRMLPAGPYRESVSALQRADLVIITSKSASASDVGTVRRDVESVLGQHAAIAAARLDPVQFVAADGSDVMSLDTVRGQSVLAVAAIGDPDSFFGQLRQLGADVTEARYRDHHEYDAADAAQLAAKTDGHKYVIATQKDVVKLAKLWPAAASQLWYLSQAVRITEGTSLVTAALANLFQRATSIV